MRSEITISDLRLKRYGELNPLIVKFLNGDVTEKKLSTVKAKLIPHENLRERAVEISTADKQNYVNDPVNGLLGDNRFIAIRNKKTNKVRLVEVEYAPLINAVFLKKQEKIEDDKDRKQQYAALQRVFGTKKAVRHLEQKIALDIDNSHIESQINELLDNEPADEKEDDDKTANDVEEDCLSRLIPPCYRDAANIFDVYKVEDCISDVEISTLADGIKEILNKDKKSLNHSLYIQTYLPDALSTSENLEVRLACLLYADALVKYVRVNAKGLSKAAQTFCPHSETIGAKIISEFCVKNGSLLNRPLIMKDKAVCHIIVLTLLACNYRIDLGSLAKIVSYGYKKVTQLGRILGLVKAGKTSTVHTLVLPLPPPVKLVKKAPPRK